MPLMRGLYILAILFLFSAVPALAQTPVLAPVVDVSVQSLDGWNSPTVWATMIGAGLGGLIAAGAGWLVQMEINRHRDKTKRAWMLNGIGSEMHQILRVLEDAKKATPTVRTLGLADLDRHMTRYPQVTGQMGVLPSALVSKIDEAYGAVLILASAAKGIKALGGVISNDGVDNCIKLISLIGDDVVADLKKCSPNHPR